VPETDRILTPPRSRLRVGAGAAIVLVLAGLGVAVAVAAFGSHGSAREVAAPSASAAPDRTAPLYVHVLGAVARPGLYLLAEGDRAVDAIAAAGGFTAEADQGQLNLARPLVDGEQVVVPVIGAAPAPAAAGTTAGKVNLNTAGVDELDTLPRIGPAVAQRIIDWREANGRFGTVDDLMNVTGIGQKTFDGLKDLVTV